MRTFLKIFCPECPFWLYARKLSKGKSNIIGITFSGEIPFNLMNIIFTLSHTIIFFQDLSSMVSLQS